MYPAHGAGRVAAREKRVVLGAEQEVVVLELLADGLSVTLPMQLARELLRPLVSEAGLSRVQETLREDGALSGDVWVKRLKQVQAKLRGGDPLELAEIVRDGARRQGEADRERHQFEAFAKRERALREGTAASFGGDRPSARPRPGGGGRLDRRAARADRQLEQEGSV